MESEYLTIVETAQLLKLTQYTVRKMCKSGALPAKQINPKGAWRISRSKLKKILP